MVLRRVARLPAAAQSLARAVAVLDEHAELRYGAALCGLELADAADAADGLARVELLAQSERRLRFVHPIVRAAIYAEMPTADRSVYHACAARLLDTDHAPVDQVAAHLVVTLPCGDRWVVQVLRSAAERALSQGTPDAAISYLRRALDEPLPPTCSPTSWRRWERPSHERATRVRSSISSKRSSSPALPSAEPRSRLTSAGR
jgi:hypothetical protein